jgi:hypothetical protein
LWDTGSTIFLREKMFLLCGLAASCGHFAELRTPRAGQAISTEDVKITLNGCVEPSSPW